MKMRMMIDWLVHWLVDRLIGRRVAWWTALLPTIRWTGVVRHDGWMIIDWRRGWIWQLSTRRAIRSVRWLIDWLTMTIRYLGLIEAAVWSIEQWWRMNEPLTIWLDIIRILDKYSKWIDHSLFVIQLLIDPTDWRFQYLAIWLINYVATSSSID